jgi:hypothetical protein
VDDGVDGSEEVFLIEKLGSQFFNPSNPFV